MGISVLACSQRVKGLNSSFLGVIIYILILSFLVIFSAVSKEIWESDINNLLREY